MWLFGVRMEFQCSSASRKFLNPPVGASWRTRRSEFQCSSASRKFLNRPPTAAPFLRRDVSVLFSEPKIPQSFAGRALLETRTSFSALQRAENSSISSAPLFPHPAGVFQCSSASRKFLNSSFSPGRCVSSPFQCSSASRKFLNFTLIESLQP